MNPQNLLTMFHGQPWAISLAGWRSLLAHMQAAPPSQPQAIERTKREAIQVGKMPDGRKIGVLSVSGPMVKGVPQWACDWMGLANVDAIHDGAAAAREQGVSTLVLHLDSPGGMVCGTAEAGEALADLRESGTHLIGYTETMACSAAYWLAAACDEIIAAPSALVGSVGCICQVVDVSGMLDNAGIKVEYFVNEGSEAKLYGRAGVAMDDSARASFQGMVDKIGARFKAHVSAGRPKLAAKDMNGDAWPAEDAPDGYVDHVSFPDATGRMRPVSRIDNLLTILAGV